MKKYISAHKIFSVIFLLPITLFATSFRDSLKVFQPNAIARTISVVSAFSDTLSKAHLSHDALRLMDFIGDSLEDFNFRKIYRSDWLQNDQHGFRSVTIEGEHRDGGYHISVSHRDLTGVNLSRAFNSAVIWSLKENPVSVVKDAHSFPARVNLRLATEHLNHANILSFLGQLLLVIEPSNLEKLQPGMTHYFSAQPSALSDAAAADFPHLIGFLDRLTTVLSLLKIRQFQGKYFTELHFVARLKEDHFHKAYPHLFRWLGDLGELVKLHISLYDEKGRHLLGLAADPEQKEIQLHLLTAKGKLIPRDHAGNPLYSAGFALAALKEKKVRLDVKVQANISGLKLDTGWMNFSGQYRNLGQEGNLKFTFDQAPAMKFYGRFYKVLPVWLIDVVIPSNIEQLMKDFILVMQQGHEGRGTSVGLQFLRKSSGMHYLDGQIETEILDNHFIRIALKIWNRRMRPKQKAVEELRTMFFDISQELLKDLRRL